MANWRLNQDSGDDFDELIVSDDGTCVLHVEMLDDRELYIRAGGWLLYLSWDEYGKPRVTVGEKPEGE